jgi:hypothetical protein
MIVKDLDAAHRRKIDLLLAGQVEGDDRPELTEENLAAWGATEEQSAMFAMPGEM